MSNVSASHTHRRKLLYIVTWNIGGLDFMVAVLWKLRTQYPNVDITVFFAEPHYDHVLRGGRFFLELFNSLGIEYKDFRDLLPTSTQSLVKMLDPILAMSPLDYTTPKWIQRLQHFFNRRILSGERFAKFLQGFSPDCIIIDDRKYYLRPFCGYTELEAYYNAHPTTPIIQIPHAIKSEYYGDLFPNRRLCEIWLPLVAKEESMVAVRDFEHVYQTFVPSLDTNWVEFIRLSQVTSFNSNTLTCVLLLEPFEMQQDKKRSKNKFITFEGMYEFFMVISQTQENLSKELHLVIKPHPKQEKRILNRLISQTKLRNYTISNETCHNFLNVNICISMLTTTAYSFLVARIPTLMILTQTIKVMPLPELYKNLTYACHTPEEIMNALNEILSTGHRDIERDYQHIRSYLPDHALDTVMSRLRLHLRLEDPQEV